MPTIFSHAVAAAALAPVVLPRPLSGRVVAVAAVAAALPDLDVAGFALGIRYDDPLGHRGLSHSIAFAAVLGAALLPLAPRELRGARTWLFLFLAVASHGLLDATTDGGRGIALLAPLDWTRYFLPWRPIEVSPIGARFFSSRGAAVLMSELLWIWLPSAAIAGAAFTLRGGRREVGGGRK